MERMLEGKFTNVPVENDTVIIMQAEMKFGEYDVLYQKWVWDGITAESIIFLKEDVLNLVDEDLKDILRGSLVVDLESQVTIKRNEAGYTFVSFNFVTSYDDEGYTEPEPLSAEDAARKKKNARATYARTNDSEIVRIKKLRTQAS